MLRVGLTGGLASGKSFIGRELERLGCYVIRMDELGHRALEPGGEAYFQVVAEFEREVPLVRPDGSIDRRALELHVFADNARLMRLNAIVHPAARRHEQALAEAFFRDHPDGIAITEAAILLETNRYRDYDRLIVAICLREQQIQRATARGGLTEDEALLRMSRQIPLDEKRKYGHFVIDTSGTEQHTLDQTKAVWEALRSIHR